MTMAQGLKGRGVARLFGVDWPIVQAPMAGGITTPALVAACCEAGALGSLGAAVLSPDRIRAEVAAIRALTRKPFAINLFVLDEPERFSRDGEAEAMARIASWRVRLGLHGSLRPRRMARTWLSNSCRR